MSLGTILSIFIGVAGGIVGTLFDVFLEYYLHEKTVKERLFKGIM